MKPKSCENAWTWMKDRVHGAAAVFSFLMIVCHLLLRFLFHSSLNAVPLMAALLLGGIPVLWIVIKDLLKGNFGADVLAGVSIITSLLLGEYLAGTIIVLMWSSGSELERYAVRHASSVLETLAKRMPSTAHRKEGDQLREIQSSEIHPGDLLAVFPHEICPVDGVVVEGRGTMDEAYLTGEPFHMDKAVGSPVISGAINGSSSLSIQATKAAQDSRYAKIMEVMRASEQDQPQLKRLGDQLGAIYTPVSLLIAGLSWWLSHEPSRFLAVLVIATPCPLLIGIPVAIFGAISLAAKRGIIIKNSAILEQIDQCKIAIFDKTGTLTFGTPEVSEVVCAKHVTEDEVLSLAASLERYSKHPLARAIVDAAQKKNTKVQEASEVHEIAGEGLRGMIAGRSVHIAGRKQLPKFFETDFLESGTSPAGLECLVAVDEKPAAIFRFRDTPRPEGVSFIGHLGPKHQFVRTMILSGDRESEVRYLAEKVGVSEIHAQKSPEEKLDIVKAAVRAEKTLFVGDGINDAPSLMAATVGVSIGQNSDITSQASDAVVMDSSLTKVDELMHIGKRMRIIALQSAVGGMAISLVGMFAASAGYLSPVAGAVMQEIVDVLAILNALRTALPPKELSDFFQQPKK